MACSVPELAAVSIGAAPGAEAVEEPSAAPAFGPVAAAPAGSGVERLCWGSLCVTGVEGGSGAKGSREAGGGASISWASGPEAGGVAAFPGLAALSAAGWRLAPGPVPGLPPVKGTPGPGWLCEGSASIGNAPSAGGLWPPSASLSGRVEPGIPRSEISRRRVGDSPSGAASAVLRPFVPCPFALWPFAFCDNPLGKACREEFSSGDVCPADCRGVG